MQIEATEELPYRIRANAIAKGVAFCLNVNPVEAECILVNDAVDSFVAAAAERPASLGGRDAKAHGQKEIDDEAFKEIRRGRADSIKQILREGRLDLLGAASIISLGGSAAISCALTGAARS